MKYTELKSDTYIKNWLSEIGAKPNTRAIYIDSMRAYTEFLQKNPETIVTESEADIKAGLLMRERKISADLREFREFLESSDMAPMSVKGRLTGVRSFYNFYSIQLPVLPRSSTKARPLMAHREIPTKEDIREVLSTADLLEKAIVLTGVSSGLSVNEISNLKVKEFMDGYDKETEITTLHLIREKVGYEFHTFLTPEASKAVLEYLEFRDRTTEKNDSVRQEQLLKQKITYVKNPKGENVPTGYLFIGRYISTEYLKLKDSKKLKERLEGEELRKLSTKAIQKIYRELSERARKSSPFGEWNLLRSHNIRKWCYSTLLANRAELFFVDYVTGHQIDSTRDAYYRADPKALREEYQKYIPYLTISKELNVSDSPDYQNIKNENDILRAQAARATVERTELEELKKQFAEMNAMYAEMFENVIPDPETSAKLRKTSTHRLKLLPEEE